MYISEARERERENKKKIILTEKLKPRKTNEVCVFLFVYISN